MFTCRQNFESDLEENSLLIVQCDNGNENARLVACAQFCVLDLQQQVADKKTGKSHVVFIIHLPRVSGVCFAGFRVSLKLFSSCTVRKKWEFTDFRKWFLLPGMGGFMIMKDTMVANFLCFFLFMIMEDTMVANLLFFQPSSFRYSYYLVLCSI